MDSCIYTGSNMVTFEHAIIYAGKQINSRWAIVPCEPQFNIGAVGKVKDFNRWVAYLRLMYSDPLYFDSQISKYNIDIREFIKLNFKFSLSDYPELSKRLCKHRIMGI